MLSLKQIILIVIILISSVSHLPAQYENVVFSDLESYEGLSNNIVRAITQDKFGFIWIGTQYGLYKYDGYKFTSFFHNPKDPNSISYNWITALHCDYDGTIWIGTFGGGLNRYNPSTEEFTCFTHDSEVENSLCDNYILSLTSENRSNGDVWIGTQNGLSKLHLNGTGTDSEQVEFTNFNHNPGSQNSFI